VAAEGIANAGDALLAVLADRGIEYLFGNAGTDFPSIIEGFARASLEGRRVPQPVTVPHENVAMAMAHGFYLATGRPQAVMVHVNVGTANAICGLINAARENIPILLMAGRTPITEEGRTGGRSVYIHWGQEMFDQGGMVREFVKWDYELRDPSQVEAAIDRALNLATAEPKGPVYLTLPREILAAGAGAQALHPAGWRSAPAAPAPDAAALAAAASWLAAAENPVLVTASYGRNPADVPALAALAEAAALPVVQYRPRYLALPSAHPMHLGYEPGSHLGDADLVVVLDCDVPWVPRLHKPNPAARVIHIAADPLYQRYPMRGFRCDLALAGGSAATLRALEAALAAQRDAALAARIERRRGAVTAKRQAIAARSRALAAAAATAPAPNAAAIVAAFEPLRRASDMIVAELALPLGLMDLAEPGTYFGNSPAGGLGWGLGCALGLKLAAPERRVIAFVGDGTYMFANPTPAHFVSAALGLPTLTVILNNRMWAAVRRATLSVYPDGAAAKVNRAALTYLEPAPAYEAIVRASGGHGERVERVEDLPGAFARALYAVEVEKRQAVLNVLTEYSDAEAVADARR
jgi:acetolactate synthase-1/2/3 large subunit